MRSLRFNVLVVVMAALLAAPRGMAQVNIGGISFVDRGLTGEIVLGDLRGGLSVLDYDHDGFMDLLIAGYAGQPTRLFHNVPDPLNPGRRTFVDAGGDTGLRDAAILNSEGRILVTGDYDNDGHDDVFLSGIGGSPFATGLLYRNNGDGTFTNVTAAAGVRITGASCTSASWCDYDLDGWLDLMYVCSPGGSRSIVLLRNNGNGTFSDAAASLPAVTLEQIPYAHGWVDLDQDGWPECLIPQSASTGVLLRNVSDGAGGRMFIETGAADGFVDNGVAPMGVTAGDFDEDGDLDIAMSDAAAGSYYRNIGGGRLQKITPFVSDFGWGVSWIDAENDGDLDLYMCGRLSRANFDRLFRNLGNGTFDDIGTALNGAYAASQHCVQIDFNNDGRQDIVTLNPGTGTPGMFTSVFENVSTAGNHWIKVALDARGPGINRNAANAVVRVVAGGRTQIHEILVGSSYTVTEDLRQNFGLGQTTVVDRIEVVWPRRGTMAGRTDVFDGPFAADQIITLAPRPTDGDVNCDGRIDGDDLEGFVTALFDPAGTSTGAALCDRLRADLNHDDQVNGQDASLFVGCLVNGGCGE